ncbi:MAG: hypothetical protein ACK4PK_12245 [Alphaproteobacteria bacterium]
MSVLIPFGSAAQAETSLAERAAQTLHNLNNADSPPPAVENPRYAERALDALLEKHATMTDLTAPRGWRVLEIDLVGIRQEEKKRGGYEGKLVAMIDGLEERGGVWKGERLHIRTNDPEIEKHMRVLREQCGAQEATCDTSLQHDVSVPASPNIHKRAPKLPT